MTWVTRARVIPSRWAISALFWTSPASSCRRHMIALRRSLTTRGVLGFLGGVGLHLRGESRSPPDRQLPGAVGLR
jgi:hypothetical protein